MTAKALPTFRFPDGTCIPQAIPQAVPPVTLDSPALSVMTDLTLVRAATVQPDTSLDKTEEKMIQEGVRMLFVVEKMPCVDGIVTSSDLRGDKPMKLVSQRQVRRVELSVHDVMTKLSELDMVELEAVQRSSVADIVATMRTFGRPHLLVVEAATSTSAPRIRGLISHTQIERQIGQALPMVEIASTFGEIEKALT